MGVALTKGFVTHSKFVVCGITWTHADNVCKLIFGFAASTHIILLC